MRATGTFCLLGTALALTATPLSAQLSVLDKGAVQEIAKSPFAKDYKVDFAIPDAPAFKLLEVSQSAILRPQTVHSLTLAASGFRGANGGFVVPQEFGIEASPAMLIGGRLLPVASYQQKRLLYATRLSAATKRDSLGRSQLAAGLRINLVDEQDMRDESMASKKEMTDITAAMLKIYRAARTRAGVVGPGDTLPPLVLTKTDSAHLDSLKAEIKSHWADRYWNARSFDLAVAARATTSDSLGHDPQFGEFAFWATYAQPLRSAQLLIGLKAGTARDTVGNFTQSNTVALRFYFGSNDAKLFAEGQQALSSAATGVDWLFNSGAEFRVPNLGWATASAGVETEKGATKPRVVATFRLKAEVPGLP